MTDAGRLHFDGQTLHYDGPEGRRWSIAPAQLRAIASYTTEAGPEIDDRAVVFIRHDGDWLRASAYASGCDEVLEALGGVLGAPLRLTDANIATWSSRGLWPASIAGEQCFSLMPLPPATWGARVRAWLGAPDQLIVLRPDIAARLGLPVPVRAT